MMFNFKFILQNYCGDAAFDAIRDDTRLQQDHIWETLAFVRASTESFDKSHDYIHAIRVMVWSVLISDTEIPNCDFELLTASALLHDVRDHKYPDSVSETEVIQQIRRIYGHRSDIEAFTQDIMNIIANVSFSKQRCGKRKRLDEKTGAYLDVVSDADRLESLGDEGIWRALVFTIHNKKTEPVQEVFKVYRERQLPLFPEFIATATGQQYGKSRYDHIAAFVDRYCYLADSEDFDSLVESVTDYCKTQVS